MAANISVGDWQLLVERVTQAEGGLAAERAERGQFVTALQEAFTNAQGQWATLSASLEELRAQFMAYRACMPGGEAAAVGPGLLHPKLLGSGPRPFSGDAREWRDW